MANSYKILGQIAPTANALTNVYVTGASVSSVVNTIYLCNQDSANANVSVIVRPVNEALANKHYILKGVTIPRADSLIFSPGITLTAAVIIAVNNSVHTGETAANVAFNVYGVELT